VSSELDIQTWQFINPELTDLDGPIGVGAQALLVNPR
jgi:hypothetical protein